MINQRITGGLCCAVVAVCAGIFAVADPHGAQQDAWPTVWNRYSDPSMVRMNLFKTAGMEMTDGFWAHLHQGMTGADSVTLGMRGTDVRSNEKPLPDVRDVQVRWVVKGSPVSDWLSSPFTFTLKADNPALPATDGIFDISIDMQ